MATSVLTNAKQALWSSGAQEKSWPKTEHTRVTAAGAYRNRRRTSSFRTEMPLLAPLLGTRHVMQTRDSLAKAQHEPPSSAHSPNLDASPLKLASKELGERGLACSIRSSMSAETFQALQRIESGIEAPSQRRFCLRQHLFAAVQALGKLADERKLAFFVRWNLPRQELLGNPEYIGLMFYGIIHGMLTTLPHGRVVVDIAGVCAPNQVCEVRISVAGRPSGSAGPITDSDAAGALQALGMSLVDSGRLCDAVGGQMRFGWHKENGPLVSASVPCTVADGAHATEMAPVPQEQGIAEALPGATILVVDDNQINQRLLQQWLSKAGATVALAGDGQAALSELSKHPVDAVLMDMSMPTMNGLEATQKIREALAIGPNNTVTVPIIGMSANSQPEERLLCLQAGMNDFIAKPYRRSDLLTKVASLLMSIESNAFSARP